MDADESCGRREDVFTPEPRELLMVSFMDAVRDSVSVACMIVSYVVRFNNRPRELN